MPNHAGNGFWRWMGAGWAWVRSTQLCLNMTWRGSISADPARPIQREIDPIVLKHDMEGVD
mgnify:CR=1 FL=1